MRSQFVRMMIACGIESPLVQIRSNLFGQRDTPFASLVTESGHRAGVNYSQRNKRTAIRPNQHPAAVALTDSIERTRLSSLGSVHCSALSHVRRARIVLAAACCIQRISGGSERHRRTMPAARHSRISDQEFMRPFAR
jgi:hypothetical protein